MWAALGGDPRELARLEVTGPRTTLASTFSVTDAATAAVGASLLAATLGSGVPVVVDTRQLAVAVRSERYVRRDGRSGGSPFDPLSAFHRTSDGWLRLHANYAWHREAALRVLGCAEGDAQAAIAEREAVELETALHAAGGVGAAVRTEAQWRAVAGPPPPLVEQRDLAPAAPRPARRLRVLDLTRVIAGPVATRTLAVHGADVLRLDAPHLPEIPLQAWDMLPGKRSALLDLNDADKREELLAGADVVVAGYRPGALDRFGLAPEALAARHPGLVIVTLSAWGTDGPWGSRRGFDSLVQAACGIAVDEGTPRRARRASRPGARPRHRLPRRRGRAPRRRTAAARRRHTPCPALAGGHRRVAAGPATRRARRRTRRRPRAPPRREGPVHAGGAAGHGGWRGPDLARSPTCLRRRYPGVDMNDPTGFSSPLGQIIVGLALLASLIVLLRWFWMNRRR